MKKDNENSPIFNSSIDDNKIIMVPGMMYITDIANIQQQKTIGFVGNNNTKKYPLTCIDFTINKICVVEYSVIQIKPLDITIKDYILQKNIVENTLNLLQNPNTGTKNSLKMLKTLYNDILIEHNKRTSQQNSENSKVVKNKKYFFGWTNIKRFITEILYIFSNKKSFFSKKRIESSVAFIAGQFGMIYYLIRNITTMDINDLLMWAGVEFIIAGWTIIQIQKEKKTTNEQNTENTEGPIE